MDKLLAKLSEPQQATIKEHTTGISCEETIYSRVNDHQSSSSSLPITPATDAFVNTAPTTRPASAAANDSFATTEELLRLKLELAQAQSKISRLDQELAQSRLAQSESGRVTPVVPMEAEYSNSSGGEPLGPRLAGGLTATSLSSKSVFSRESPSPWQAQEDFRAEGAEFLSAGAGPLQRSRGIWGGSKPVVSNAFAVNPVSIGDSSQTVPWQSGPTYADPNTTSYGPPSIDGYRADRLTPDHDMMMRPQAARRGGRYDARFGPAQSFGGYNSYSLGQGQFDSYGSGTAGQVSNNVGMNMYPQYQQQATGSGLSPHATEFTSGVGAPWKADVS
jgi:hypothetical protein